MDRQLFQHLMAAIPDAVYFKDRDSRFLAISKAQAEKFGLADPNDAIGKTDFDIFSEEHARQAFADEQSIIQTGEPIVGIEEKETWPDGSVTWVSTTKMPLHDESGRIVGTFGVSRDITLRKQAEAALRKSEERLKNHARELERSNAELEQFAYVASHDLQEPLRMVVSYLGLLEKRCKDKLDSDALEFLDFAVDGARRMKALIDDLLEYCRVGGRAKPSEAVDSGRVLDEAIGNLAAVIKENDAVVTHAPMPAVMADSGQLVRLFQNLIGNALKFRSEKRPEVHVGASYANGRWTFAVRDNGIGVDPKDAERVFLIFHRLENSARRPGTGIGLAISKKIVERHGGRMWLESEPGKGATFYFTFRGEPPHDS